MSDWLFSYDCPGCGVMISPDNAGGYRTYCEKCVDAMPPFPKDGNERGGCNIEGKYPNFRWVCGNGN